MHATKDADGKIQYSGESDSQLTKGLCALLVRGLSVRRPTAAPLIAPHALHSTLDILSHANSLLKHAPGVLVASLTLGYESVGANAHMGGVHVCMEFTGQHYR